jgi:hypothetical protein
LDSRCNGSLESPLSELLPESTSVAWIGDSRLGNWPETVLRR